MDYGLEDTTKYDDEFRYTPIICKSKPDKCAVCRNELNTFLISKNNKSFDYIDYISIYDLYNLTECVCICMICFTYNRFLSKPNKKRVKKTLLYRELKCLIENKINPYIHIKLNRCHPVEYINNLRHEFILICKNDPLLLPIDNKFNLYKYIDIYQALLKFIDNQIEYNGYEHFYNIYKDLSSKYLINNVLKTYLKNRQSQR
jgi:hypothetical protein